MIQPFALRAIRLLFCSCFIGILLISGYWSDRLAYADHLSASDSVADLATAAELAPGSAELLVRTAILVDRNGENPLLFLKRAAALDPSNAGIWMQIGLQAELAGDLQTAEHCLLEAARVSKQYRPRWTLANFYFRRGDENAFWNWAKQALEISYGDRTPMFQLCWRISQDPGMTLDRAIPRNRAVLRDYLAFLVAQDRLQAAHAVAKSLVENTETEDVGGLLSYCNRALETGLPDAALYVWNSLCAQKLLPFSALLPERGLSVTNGDLSIPISSAGFDWRTPTISGIAAIQFRDYARFSLSGRQPEHCEFLAQFAPALPARDYKLNFQYQTTNIRPDSGIRWKVFDAMTGSELAIGSQDLSSEVWTDGQLTFSTAPTTHLVRLVLSYHRRLGTVRVEGTASLRRVRLDRMR